MPPAKERITAVSDVRPVAGFRYLHQVGQLLIYRGHISIRGELRRSADESLHYSPPLEFGLLLLGEPQKYSAPAHGDALLQHQPGLLVDESPGAFN